VCFCGSFVVFDRLNAFVLVGILLTKKDANKEKVTQTIENDERTAKTHKNPNGNLGPKSQRKTSTHDDNKENQSTKF